MREGETRPILALENGKGQWRSEAKMLEILYSVLESTQLPNAPSLNQVVSYLQGAETRNK